MINPMKIVTSLRTASGVRVGMNVEVEVVVEYEIEYEYVIFGNFGGGRREKREREIYIIYLKRRKE